MTQHFKISQTWSVGSSAQFENRIMPGVYKEHYAWYYVPKSSILLAGTGAWKISLIACGFSSIAIDYSDYLKRLISRKMMLMYFSLKYRFSGISLKRHQLHYNCFFCCDHTCYCGNMISVTSASFYLTSASRYLPRCQSRSLMYIRGLIPRNFAELAETVPIVATVSKKKKNMISKYHNHKLQTNPWHHEEEPHNNHETPGRQTKQNNQLSLPHQVEWTIKTKNNYRITQWE